jgi:hypothetical protein
MQAMRLHALIPTFAGRHLARAAFVEPGGVAAARAAAVAQPATIEGTQTQVLLSVTVPQQQAEALRRALFDRLYQRITRIVIAPGTELGMREAQIALEVVLEHGALDEALHTVMVATGSARLGAIRSV